MFSQLTDLGFKRSALQATGFYLAYFFLGMLIGLLVGLFLGVLGLWDLNDGNTGEQIGASFAIPYCVAVAIGIGVKKGIVLEFKMLVLYAITGILAVFLGLLLGLVIPAYLTTLDSAKASH